jgi:hypothetical protein
MKYRLKKNIDGLSLLEGDIFEWRKNGYTHEYMDDNWIGLPQCIVEDNHEYFELCSRVDDENLKMIMKKLIKISSELDDLANKLYEYNQDSL